MHLISLSYNSPSLIKVLLTFYILLLTGCDSQGPATNSPQPGPIDSQGEVACDLDPNFLSSVLGRDVIPALSDPALVSPSQVSYLKDDDLVLGIELDNTAIAIPHNILWHHEVINFNSFSIPFSVTYCPLTGSGLAFDRSDFAGVEFGVSGLLYRNNLVLFDRMANESLWPQLSRSAQCGPAHATPLFMMPTLELTWGAWKKLQPATKVVSEDTGHDRDYTRSPYGNYDEPNNASLLFDMDIDTRRPPKERVLVLPQGQGGLAFPFGLLDNGDAGRAVHAQFRGQDIVVFWSKEMNAAAAYSLPQDAPARTFRYTGSAFTDVETGSTWLLDGRASDGSLRGLRLKNVSNAYIAFWFAWAAFHPETDIWQGS